MPGGAPPPRNPAAPDTSSSEPPASPPRTRSPQQSKSLVRAPGGSRVWNDSVRRALLASYDHDHSGDLNTRQEIYAIPCAEWRSIESSYEQGELGVSMTRLYGFDGSDAPANTLGITQAMRPTAYERMRDCGLQ